MILNNIIEQMDISKIKHEKLRRYISEFYNRYYKNRYFKCKKCVNEYYFKYKVLFVNEKVYSYS